MRHFLEISTFEFIENSKSRTTIFFIYSAVFFQDFATALQERIKQKNSSTQKSIFIWKSSCPQSFEILNSNCVVDTSQSINVNLGHPPQWAYGIFKMLYLPPLLQLVVPQVLFFQVFHYQYRRWRAWSTLYFWSSFSLCRTCFNFQAFILSIRTVTLQPLASFSESNLGWLLLLMFPF